MEQPDIKLWGEEILDLARSQCDLLGAMFEDPGLNRLRDRHPRHPAVIQHDELVELERNGVRWPDELSAVNAVSEIGLDFSAWIPTPMSAEFWDFLDEETARWTLRMMEDPDQYGDVMAELFVWGWLNTEGLAAARVNRDGHSDILVGTNKDWPCEVKRIRLGTQPKRIRNVLNKANRQIKTTSPKGSGSVVVIVDRPLTRVAFDDRVPNDVSSIVDLARRALHPGQLRSIAQLTVCWDDVMFLGEAPDPMLYAFRRRSLVLEHPQPRATAKHPVTAFEIGRTMTSWIKYQPSGEEKTPPELAGIDASNAHVSQLFREQNEFPSGMRATHALEVLAEPDDVARLGDDEARVVLATRSIDQGGQPCVLLVIAVEGLKGKPEVVGGYRLYQLEHELDLSRDALACFRIFLERYGLDVSIPQLTSRFIPYCVVPPGIGIGLPEEPDQYFISTLAKRRSDGSTEFACVYAVDTRRYRAALKQRRS